MSKQITKIPVFHKQLPEKYEYVEEYPLKEGLLDFESRFKKMAGSRKYQLSAYETFMSNPQKHMILKFPCGSGKSTIIQFCSVAALEQDENLRCIIAVPQTIIGSGFNGLWQLEFPDERQRFVGIDGVNCLTSPSPGSNCKRLIAFLKETVSIKQPLPIDNRILLCTHQTLGLAFNLMSMEDRKELFKNTLIWFDECHHIRNAQTETGLESNNQLGNLVSFLVNNAEDINARLGLVTATFQRGDRFAIINPENKDAFFSSYLSYPEYFKHLRYLKSYTYDFIFYNQNPLKEIAKLFKEKKKTVIYLPAQNLNCSFDSKIKQVEKIIKAITGKEIELDDKKDYYSAEETGGYNIMELVEDSPYRNAKKLLVQAEEMQEKLDVIIVVGMGKEGFDWPQAERAIIIGNRNSQTEVIQMIGRLFRDNEGKSKVEIYQMFPYSIENLDNAKVQYNLRGYLNSFNLTLQIENTVDPIRIINHDNNENENREPREPREERLGQLEQLDEEVRNNIMTDVREKVIIRMEDKNYRDINLVRQMHDEIVSSVLETYGEAVASHHEEIQEEIWQIFKRATMAQAKQITGIDISDLDFESLNPYDCLRYYPSIRHGSIEFNGHSWKELAETYFSSLPLAEEQILEWCDRFYEINEEYPKIQSGQIFDTNETWNAINSCLYRGGRGLPGGSSLPQFLEKHRNYRPNLTEERILELCDEYYEINNKYPNTKTGKISDTDETWSNIDSSLSRGNRELSGGSSLMKFLKKHRNHNSDLTEEQILELCDKFYEINNRFPNAEDGQIFDTDETWRKIYDALYRGTRGLPGGSSLPQLLAKHRDYQNNSNLPDFTEKQILSWCDKFYEINNRYPNVEDGQIFDTNETWNGINRSLYRGNRGLSGGSSLVRLLEKERGVINRMNLLDLTEERILELCDEYYNKHNNKYPKVRSGIIEGTNETWINIDSSLSRGGRGLPGGSSLHKLLKKYRGK